MEDVATYASACGGSGVGVRGLLSTPQLLCGVSCFLLYLQFCDVPLLGLGKSFDSSWHKSSVESWKVEE